MSAYEWCWEFQIVIRGRRCRLSVGAEYVDVGYDDVGYDDDDDDVETHTGVVE